MEFHSDLLGFVVLLIFFLGGGLVGLENLKDYCNEKSCILNPLTTKCRVLSVISAGVYILQTTRHCKWLISFVVCTESPLRPV
jgi:hypothetical protein